MEGLGRRVAGVAAGVPPAPGSANARSGGAPAGRGSLARHLPGPASARGPPALLSLAQRAQVAQAIPGVIPGALAGVGSVEG